MSLNTASVRTAMEQHDPQPSHLKTPPGATSGNKSQGDPWHAFGYLVSGVLFYGFLGWLADRWLDTRFFIVAGIFVGAGLGIYLTFGRFSPKQPASADKTADDNSRVTGTPQDPKQENK